MLTEQHSILDLSSCMFSIRRLATEVRRTGVRLASGVPERDPRFATVRDADLRFFESVLGGAGVVTDPHELARFNKCVGRENAQAFQVLYASMHDGEQPDRSQAARRSQQRLLPPVLRSIGCILFHLPVLTC